MLLAAVAIDAVLCPCMHPCRACAASDPLHAGLSVPIPRAASSPPRSGGVAARSAVTGGGSAARAAAWAADDVAMRFAGHGFAYVGHARLLEEGPSRAAGQHGFVSRLT